ncbi:MAG: hypothetical protein ACX930_09410 [Erythrobacter sp.]
MSGSLDGPAFSLAISAGEAMGRPDDLVSHNDNPSREQQMFEHAVTRDLVEDDDTGASARQ